MLNPYYGNGHPIWDPQIYINLNCSNDIKLIFYITTRIQMLCLKFVIPSTKLFDYSFQVAIAFE